MTVTNQNRVQSALRLLVGFCLVLLLIACSPEASRTRGGGPGGDIGNRATEVELRPLGPKVIYFNTPKEGAASQVAGMPVE